MFNVTVVEAPKEALEKAEDGEWTLDQDGITKTVQEMEVRGNKNANARLLKMAEKHKAHVLSDTLEMDAIMGVGGKTAPAPKPKSPQSSPPVAAPTMPPAVANARKEAAQKTQPKASQAAAPKAEVVALPDDYEVKLAALGANTAQISKLARSPKSVKLVIDNNIPMEAVNILFHGGCTIMDKKLPADHPYLSRDGAPAPQVAKDGKGAAESVKTKPAKTPSKASAPRESAPKGNVKAHKLEVHRSAWGADRWYDVGATHDHAEATRVASDWEAAGFETRLKPMTTGYAKRNIWTIPGEPIVSAIPGDSWVGDHLGPHLRAMGVTAEEYRKTYGYNGPMCVNRAAASLAAAHNVVKRDRVPRQGGVLVEVRGDIEVIAYNIITIENGIHTLEVAASSVSGIEAGHRFQYETSEVHTRMLPLGRWAASDKAQAQRAKGGKST